MTISVRKGRLKVNIATRLKCGGGGLTLLELERIFMKVYISPQNTEI